MTGVEVVVMLVARSGRATVDDLQLMNHGMSPYQLRKALDNAMSRGYLHSLGRAATPTSMGRAIAVYEVTGKQPRPRNYSEERVQFNPDTPPDAPRGQYGHLGKVASVFDLGRGA